MNLISLKSFLQNIFESNTGPRNTYVKSFPEQSSKGEKKKIHAPRPASDKDMKTAIESYVKTSNTVNPSEIDKEELPKNKNRREHFQKQIRRAIGKTSETGHSAEGDAHIYRGQAHPATVDATGHVTFHRPKSWSTSPSVANANAHRNQNPDTFAHHIYHLHHKENSEHKIISAVPHVPMNAKEEEVISAPSKYKLTHSEHVGNDVRTGKPIIKHRLEYVGHPS